MKQSIIFRVFLCTLMMFITMTVYSRVNCESVFSNRLSVLMADDSEDNDSVKPLKWDKIPVYSAKKVTLTNEDGTPMLNEDGTPVTRVFLVDQFGNKRSWEAVNEQYRKLDKAVTRIIAKVGGGAIVGALTGLLVSKDKDKGKGAAIGAVAGAAGGLALSAKDIKQAKAQKKSLKQQKKLLEAYQKTFTCK